MELAALIFFGLIIAVLLLHALAYCFIGRTLNSDIQPLLRSNDTVAVTRSSQLTFSPMGTPVRAGLIFHPGGYVDPEAYSAILSPLAEAGIMCIAIPGRFRIPILNRSAANKVMDDHPNIQHWFIAGHSIGGVVANLVLRERKHLHNISGLILLGSFCIDRFSLAKIRLPALSIHGSRDRMSHKFDRFRKNLPQPETTIEIDGGNHGQFGHYKWHFHDNPATISRKQQQQITISAMLDFINLTLKP